MAPKKPKRDKYGRFASAAGPAADSPKKIPLSDHMRKSAEKLERAKEKLKRAHPKQGGNLKNAKKAKPTFKISDAKKNLARKHPKQGGSFKKVKTMKVKYGLR